MNIVFQKAGNIKNGELSYNWSSQKKRQTMARIESNQTAPNGLDWKVPYTCELVGSGFW